VAQTPLPCNRKLVCSQRLTAWYNTRAAVRPPQRGYDGKRTRLTPMHQMKMKGSGVVRRPAKDDRNGWPILW